MFFIIRIYIHFLCPQENDKGTYVNHFWVLSYFSPFAWLFQLLSHFNSNYWVIFVFHEWRRVFVLQLAKGQQLSWPAGATPW